MYAREKKWGHEGWEMWFMYKWACSLERKYPGPAIWLLIELSLVKAIAIKVNMMKWYIHFI